MKVTSNMKKNENGLKNEDNLKLPQINILYVDWFSEDKSNVFHCFIIKIKVFNILESYDTPSI